MVKHIGLSIALFLGGVLSVTGQGWKTGSISGEGEVVKQEISLASFSGIDLGFNGDVILTQGSVQKVVVEGQQNIIDNIKRDVSDGKWRISFVESVKDAKPVKVYITVPRLDYIGLSGSGTITNTGKFAGLGDVDIAVSGSGDIAFNYDGVDSNVRVSGSGKIELSGSTKTLDVAISGSGDIMAKELVSAECEIHISGSGDAAVYVNGELETHISGSGDVRYRGDASVKARISGSGEVVKL